MVRAFLVTTPYGNSITFSEKRSRAMWVNVRGFCENMGQEPKVAFKTFKIRRYPEYDYLAEHEDHDRPFCDMYIGERNLYFNKMTESIARFLRWINAQQTMVQEIDRLKAELRWHKLYVRPPGDPNNPRKITVVFRDLKALQEKVDAVYDDLEIHRKTISRLRTEVKDLKARLCYDRG